MEPVVERRLAIRARTRSPRELSVVLLALRAQKVEGYFRKNFGAPFIIGFIVLLLVAAGLLVMGDSVLANDVSVYAYYSLVVGVVLQLVSLKYGKQG